MLEKNGHVVLVDNDLDEFYEGRVSPRVQREWGFTLEELHEVIQSKRYTLGKPEYKTPEL